MSQLSERIESALKMGKSVWIVAGDETVNAKTAGITTNIIKGEGCEYFEIDDGKNKRLFNLIYVNEIKIS